MTVTFRKLQLVLLHALDKGFYGKCQPMAHQYIAEKVIFLKINLLLQQQQRINNHLFR
jgi:hypothetical protein